MQCTIVTGEQFLVNEPQELTSATPVSPDAARLPSRAAESWAEVVLCSGYPTQIAIGFLLTVAGLAATTPDRRLSAPFLFALSLVDTVVLLSLILWFLVRRGERPLAVFFGDRPFIREAAVGAFSVPFVVTIVVAIAVAVRAFAPGLHNVPENPLEQLLGTQAGFWAFLFVVIVAGGIREELQRAFLLHRFRHDLGGAGLGVIVTSIAFGLGHTLQGWDAALITGALGATWGVMYLKRGSAAASMVSHSLFNSGELLRAFLR